MPKPLQLKGHEHLAILRLSAMGDVILVVPLIVSLQRAYPALKITWIISDIFYPLVQSLQDVDFLVIKKPKTLLDYWRLRKRLKPYRFDVLLAIQASLRVNIITALINARHKIGYDKKRARDLQGLFINRRIPFARQHLLDSFLAFLSPLGIKKKSIDWPLCWPEKDRAWAAAFREPHKKLIVLHPCASKPERNASAAFYIALCQALNEQKNVTLLLSGGHSPAEQAMSLAICRALPFVKTVIGQSTLTELAALLAQADVLIAPDTGAVHVAVAVNTPVVGLYAVSPLEKSGPYLEAEWSVDKYAQAAAQFLKLDPRQIPWDTKVHHPDAMQLISVDEVLAKVQQILAKRP